jgi:antitoxin component YwqK of YwqJK toxin-antitoxin module
MILETREIKQYHNNGQLMYESTLNVVAPMFAPLYKNTIHNEKGEILIRTGITKRFWNNGQINWQLKYNDDGSLLNDNFPQFRKDGSVITY